MTMSHMLRFIHGLFLCLVEKKARKTSPDLFKGILVPKEEELVADHQRKNGRDNVDKYFTMWNDQSFFKDVKNCQI